MKTCMTEYSGLWLSVICWLAFVILVAVLIGGGESLDAVVFGK